MPPWGMEPRIRAQVPSGKRHRRTWSFQSAAAGLAAIRPNLLRGRDSSGRGLHASATPGDGLRRTGMNRFEHMWVPAVVLGLMVSSLNACVRVGTTASRSPAEPAPTLQATQPATTPTPVERTPAVSDDTPDDLEEAPANDRAERGIASWYGEAHHGKPTASGEPFDMYAMTAAHPSLDMGTRVEVENLGNGRTVIVRINDRGPFTGDRVIDVSMAAAQALGFVAAGTAEVEVRLLR